MTVGDRVRLCRHPQTTTLYVDAQKGTEPLYVVECHSCGLRGYLASAVPLSDRKPLVRPAVQGSGKTCSSCKLHLTFDSFWCDKNKPDGRAIYCRQCSRELRAGGTVAAIREAAS